MHLTQDKKYTLCPALRLKTSQTDNFDLNYLVADYLPNMHQIQNYFAIDLNFLSSKNLAFFQLQVNFRLSHQ